MEKALEILKTYINKNIGMCAVPQYVKDSIAELEEVMKPKTCKGCVREAEDMQDLHCVFCSRSCNDKFEPKDNA